MKPPTPERIKWEQHAESWNFDKPYFVGDGTYKDETKLI